MDDEQEKARTDNRSAFLVTRDCALALSRLSIRDRALLITAMAEYFLYGEVRTKLTKLSQNNFEIFKGGMDRDKHNFENKSNVKRENGRKGGIAKGKSPLYADNKGNGGDENNPEIAKIAKIAKIAHKHKQEHKHEQEQEQEQKLVSAASAATNELKNRMENFRDQCRKYVGKYDHDMVENFYYFWSEPTSDKTKMKWELQKTWSINHRLRAWKSRQTPSKGSAKPAPKNALQTMSEADIDAQQEARDREEAERKKDAISYPEHLRIVALEKQGYACDERGNVLGVKKELEAQGWVFDEWGRVKSRPKG